MEPFRYHVYICDQHKPEGIPSCPAHGSKQVIEALRKEIAVKGLADEVQVTTCGSIGLCEWGPNMVVYPEGTWYTGLRPEDIPEIVSEHFQNGKPVERLIVTDKEKAKSEIQTNKGKMMTAMKARDQAGLLPQDFLDRVRAFQESRILLTAVELDLFTVVGSGATADQVAQKLHTDTRATEMLLNALVALDTLTKQDNTYHNTPLTSRFLTEGSPDNSRWSLMHSVSLWRRWSTLTDCIREGTSVTHEEASKRGDEWTKAFISAMDKNATLRAGQVAAAVGAQGVKRLLDVGGGSGAYSIAFARANADLRAEIFDLPSVIPLSAEYIKEAGFGDRIKVRPGDLRTDKFDNGYDLVFISAICHMNSPEQNVELLKKSFDALNPGGRVVIQDFILDADKTSPRTAAMFSLNMLVGTRAGASYSEPEYNAWLNEAGFKDVRRIRLMGPTALIVAKRP
jgi:(2Fe-2S) ferredoxin/predicted O-methyltransferase YrrM